MPTVLFPQDAGYCTPIFRQMDDLFGRSTLLNSDTGTLNALLSPANRNAVDIDPISRETGKSQQYRIQFKERTACPTDFGAWEDFSTIDFCETQAPTTPTTREYVWGPDDLCSKTIWGGRYDYAYDKEHCDESLAETMASAIDEAIQNYAISFNSYLWQQLSQPYTAAA